MSTATLTLLLGDTGSYLANRAKAISNTAYLVDDNNISEDHKGVIYTSLGDITSLENFFNLLKKSTKIIYCPPEIWSDGKTNKTEWSMAWLTEHYIKLIMQLTNIPVENFLQNCGSVMSDVIPRVTDKPQLWVTGCSTTLGMGVSNDERYWEIIKKKLNLQATVMAECGASNLWCRDQLLNCDISSGDIVIWGLTTMNRFPWMINNKLVHVNTAYYKQNPDFNRVVSIATLDGAQRIYESVTSIQQVVNFCKKIGAHLVIATIHGNLEVISEAAKHKELLIIHGSQGLNFDSSFLDFGSDREHPGPKTHNMYAEKILERISSFGLTAVCKSKSIV